MLSLDGIGDSTYCVFALKKIINFFQQLPELAQNFYGDEKLYQVFANPTDAPWFRNLGLFPNHNRG